MLYQKVRLKDLPRVQIMPWQWITFFSTKVLQIVILDGVRGSSNLIRFLWAVFSHAEEVLCVLLSVLQRMVLRSLPLDKKTRRRVDGGCYGCNMLKSGCIQGIKKWRQEKSRIAKNAPWKWEVEINWRQNFEEWQYVVLDGISLKMEKLWEVSERCVRH